VPGRAGIPTSCVEKTLLCSSPLEFLLSVGSGQCSPQWRNGLRVPDGRDHASRHDGETVTHSELLCPPRTHE
jgi:hypothetical protein